MFKAHKAFIIFYEKTGCGGNKRQKELLEHYGLSLEVRSLLDTPWSKESLSPFFEGLTPQQMLNRFAPQVKEESFRLEEFTKESLIEKMVEEPILIHRPLLQIGEVKLCGFDSEKLNALLHVKMPTSQTINACLSSDTCNNA